MHWLPLYRKDKDCQVIDSKRVEEHTQPHTYTWSHDPHCVDVTPTGFNLTPVMYHTSGKQSRLKFSTLVYKSQASAQTGNNQFCGYYCSHRIGKTSKKLPVEVPPPTLLALAPLYHHTVRSIVTIISFCIEIPSEVLEEEDGGLKVDLGQ